MQTLKLFFFFIPARCHAHRHYWLLPFYTTFSDLALGWGSQGQCKAKPVAHFSSWTSWYYWVRFNEVIVVLFAVSKNLNVGTCSDFCELIWFKLAVMIDIITLYILILVKVILTFIDSHKHARKLFLAKICLPVISQSFQSMRMEFSVLFKLLVWWVWHSFHLDYHIQRRELYLHDLKLFSFFLYCKISLFSDILQAVRDH